MNNKKVAVVVLNYNGVDLLKEYLPSVIENSDDANVYVIDNASTDKSLEYLESIERVQIVKLNKNLGYAGGYNEGLKQISEQYVCLLNSDVRVTKDWLKPIIKEFDSHQDTVIIQPKICSISNPEYFEYAGAAGGFIDKYGYPYCRGRIFESVEKDNHQYDDRIEIFWASGACFFTRNNTFSQLGGFDDRFFAHMEEIDLCWRSFNKGYKSVYIPTSKVYHLGGGTLAYNTANKTYLNFRNSLFMLTKNIGERYLQILLIRLILDGVAAAKFLLELKPKHTFGILRAHLCFYKNFRYFRRYSKNQISKTKYYHSKSVVWSYFIGGCKKFDCL